MEENKRKFYTKLAKYYDYLAPASTPDECQFLDIVFKKYGHIKVSRILDLGCGTGRHALLLQKMSYQVTGIDLSADMLKVAQKKSPNSIFKKMNFIYPDFAPNFFDASICMWSTIGYVSTDQLFKKFVDNISRITKNLFVFSQSNYESGITYQNDTHTSVVKIPKGEIVNQMSRVYLPETGIRKEKYFYTITENGKTITLTDQSELKLWRLDEIEKLLSPHFKILDVFGEFKIDNKFDKSKSSKKVIVAQRI
jgi:SAM-dependent methyltransferase